MDSEGIILPMSISTISISSSILFSLTDDIGLGSVVGDVIRKSPVDLDSVGKFKNFGAISSSNNSS
jgi:hypothetical protein